MRSAKRPLEVLRLLRRRPALLLGLNAYELALLASSRVFNRVFGVPPAGFSEGAFCVLLER